MPNFDFVTVGAEQRLRKAFQRAWTLYPARKIINATYRALYEVLDEKWLYNSHLKSLEKSLEVWERCRDIENPPVMLFGIINERQRLLLEDVRVEAMFQLSGEDFS